MKKFNKLFIVGALSAGILHADPSVERDPVNMGQDQLSLSDSSADALSLPSFSGAVASIKGFGEKARAMMVVASDIASNMGSSTIEAFERLAGALEKMGSLEDMITFFKVGYSQGYGKAFRILKGESGMAGIRAAEKAGSAGAAAAEVANAAAEAANKAASVLGGLFF